MSDKQPTAHAVIATAILMTNFPQVCYKLADGEWILIDSYTFNIPTLTPIKDPDKIRALEQAIQPR